MRERYGIAGRFFLYPAITYPHKNHLVLIEAFAKVLEDHPDTMLVLTGAKGSMEVRIAKEVAKLGISRQGAADSATSPAAISMRLYDEAVAMTFPSRFEGFGAPVLEAMARRCPVIAADATALPEVVEDAGCLVSPDNADQWASGNDRISSTTTPSVRELAESGCQAPGSSPGGSAADVLEDSYRHALGTTL